jgi:hypothetical protein
MPLWQCREHWQQPLLQLESWPPLDEFSSSLSGIDVVGRFIVAVVLSILRLLQPPQLPLDSNWSWCHFASVLSELGRSSNVATVLGSGLLARARPYLLESG